MSPNKGMKADVATKPSPSVGGKEEVHFI